MKKTENTLENKAKFEALYFGQRICGTIDNCHKWYANGNSREGQILWLKPLSEITDEDAIHLAKNEWGDAFDDISKATNPTTWGKWSVSSKNTSTLSREASDYLRSKGYNVGYLDLTPEDIIDYGWAKHTNN